MESGWRCALSEQLCDTTFLIWLFPPFFIIVQGKSRPLERGLFWKWADALTLTSSEVAWLSGSGAALLSCKPVISRVHVSHNWRYKARHRHTRAATHTHIHTHILTAYTHARSRRPGI